MAETVLSWTLDAKDKASPAFNEAARSASNLGDKIGGAFKAIGIASGVLAAGVAVGVGAIVKSGVQFNSAMENYTAAFTPLLGGADAAKAKLAELTDFAAKTPFELTDVAGASQTLLAFGTSSKDLLPDLKMLGDISQGNAEKFNGLALVFGQVQSNGHLMGQDLLQMINQGFNPLNEISARTGESMSQLRDRMAAGKISFQEVQQAMIDATSAGGQFYNTMELASQTLTGAWSNTQDGVSQLSGTITTALQPALVTVLQAGLNPMLGALKDLVNGTDGAQAEVDAAAQGMVTAVQGLGPAIQSLTGNLGTVFGALGPALGAALQALIGSLTTILPGLLTLVVGMAQTLITGLPMIISVGIRVVLSLIQGITAALPTLIPAIVNAVIFMVDALVNALPAILQAGIQMLMALVQGIIVALPALIAALPDIIVNIIDFLVSSIPMLIDAGLQLFLALIAALPDIINGIVKAIPQIISGIITSLISAIPQIILAGVQLLIALVENLPTIIIEIVKAIPQIVMGIYHAFTDPATIKQLADAGGQLIQGLWQGISDLGSWLWDKVSGFFGGFVDNIKGFFGIHSPSTLFRDEVGAMLGAGMADGILASQGMVMSAASRLGKSAQVAMSGPSMSLSASSVTASSSRPTMTTVLPQARNMSGTIRLEIAGTDGLVKMARAAVSSELSDVAVELVGA